MIDGSDTTFFVSESFAQHNPDFFEPIVEKKTCDDLKKWDKVWCIFAGEWVDWDYFTPWDERSEVFLTREEAEDEHKRREWAVRKDKFIPKEWEVFYYPIPRGDIRKTTFDNAAWDILCTNLWLAFRTHEECEESINEYDLIRLFYTIR